MKTDVKTKVFISFYYDEAHKEKEQLTSLLEGIIIDKSVGENDISDDETDQRIREIIRDKYLKDSTVTIVLVGEKNKNRKHVDWEIYSSMYDHKDGHTKSGILVIDITDQYWLNTKGMRESHSLSQGVTATAESKKRNTSHYPQRLIDNILRDDVKIKIARFSDVINNIY